jgi:hypothetical protein
MCPRLQAVFARTQRTGATSTAATEHRSFSTPEIVERSSSRLFFAAAGLLAARRSSGYFVPVPSWVAMHIHVIERFNARGRCR